MMPSMKVYNHEYKLGVLGRKRRSHVKGSGGVISKG
jgi:hypothetical protein